jgi:Ser/Thr protein kinase RdoA (MazF antagonist)
MLDVESFFPVSDIKVRKRYRELLKYIENLPKDRDSYGIVHQDAHAGNFFVDDDQKITLFDFDDCCYSWFVNDIAIILFYIVMGTKDKKEFAHEFMKYFLKGYKRENYLDTIWFKEIPYFLKLREIDLYSVIHRSFDPTNISPWSERYMNGRKEKIENNEPYIDIDIDLLINI